MGDQCGVPVAASTRREKAREADVVGYRPFVNLGVSVLVCIGQANGSRTQLFHSLVWIPPPPLLASTSDTKLLRGSPGRPCLMRSYPSTREMRTSRGRHPIEMTCAGN